MGYLFWVFGENLSHDNYTALYFIVIFTMRSRSPMLVFMTEEASARKCCICNIVSLWLRTYSISILYKCQIKGKCHQSEWFLINSSTGLIFYLYTYVHIHTHTFTVMVYRMIYAYNSVVLFWHACFISSQRIPVPFPPIFFKVISLVLGEIVLQFRNDILIVIRILFGISLVTNSICYYPGGEHWTNID